MNYLARLPIDIIKIDKSLIRNINKSSNLEGVETNEELTEIKKLNGEIIQGYLFSKPLSAEDVGKWANMDKNVKHA